MLKWNVGIVLMAVIVVSQGFAAEETAEGVLDKMKGRYDEIVDLQMKFSQKTTFELSSVQQEMEGTLFLKKQNKYRIETNGQTIVTDGETVWSYNPATKQVLIDHFKLDANAITPERILGAAPQDFATSLLGTQKLGKTDVYVLKLIPRGEQSMVKSMKLWIDHATWLIKKAELTDVNGKVTEYTVTDVKVNSGLADGRFVFQAPEGSEIVDLR
jgi:outer membrane lipoprotein carrier protein